MSRKAYMAAYYSGHREELAAHQASYRATHKEEIGTYGAAYRATHKEEIRVRDRAYRAAHKKERAAYLLGRLNAAATHPRPAACEVCGMMPAGHGNTGVLHRDHDHKTGAFRAWLCHGCNAALGHVRDNPGTLEALAALLRRPRQEN